MTIPAALELQEPDAAAGRRRWRRRLWLFIVLPLLPTIALWLIGEVAEAQGCTPGQATACLVGPLSLGEAFAVAVEAARLVGEAMLVGGLAWLVLCFVAVHRGRETLRGRILFALLVALLLGYLPFVGPVLAIEDLVYPGCVVSESGIGACRMFGVAIGPEIHGLAVMAWANILASAVAFCAWAVYAVVALILGIRARRHATA
jgi:hypothetical protein